MTKFHVGQQVRYQDQLATITRLCTGKRYDVDMDFGKYALRVHEDSLEAVVVLDRQGDFLCSLMETIRINLESDTPYQGLNVVLHRIQKRLPHLKPVCYENDDLSSGFSGCGIHHICGDKASIKRVNELVHKEQFEKLYRDLYVEHERVQNHLAAITMRAIQVEKKLAQIQEISK